jgi:hypothetical protein
MLPTDSGYSSRPNKRPRGPDSLSGQPLDASPTDGPSVLPMGDDHHVANLSQHVTSSVPGPNLGLGPPPAARPRNDDRSRKLSCKECRRYVIYFFLPPLPFFALKTRATGSN